MPSRMYLVADGADDGGEEKVVKNVYNLIW